MFCNYVFLVRIHPIFFLVLLLCVLFREPKIVNGPEILDKYVGESEANIRQASAPKWTPSVVQVQVVIMWNNFWYPMTSWGHLGVIVDQEAIFWGWRGREEIRNIFISILVRFLSSVIAFFCSSFTFDFVVLIFAWKENMYLGPNSGLHIIIFDEIDAICKV